MKILTKVKQTKQKLKRRLKKGWESKLPFIPPELNVDVSLLDRNVRSQMPKTWLCWRETGAGCLPCSMNPKTRAQNSDLMKMKITNP